MEGLAENAILMTSAVASTFSPKAIFDHFLSRGTNSTSQDVPQYVQTSASHSEEPHNAGISQLPVLKSALEMLLDALKDTGDIDDGKLSGVLGLLSTVERGQRGAPQGSCCHEILQIAKDAEAVSSSCPCIFNLL